MNSKKYDKTMMKTAEIWAEQSYCKRRKVGAVLSKEGRILATGYNGTISGLPNECEERVYECAKCKHKYPVNYILHQSQSISNNNFTPIQIKKPLDIINSNPYEDDYEFYIKFNCEHCSAKNQVSVDYLKSIEPTTSDFVLHAEQNIISFCSKHGIPTKDTTLYVTTSPCKQCAKLIAQAGIREVIYKEEYKDTSGIDFLRDVYVEVRKLEETQDEQE